MKTNSVVQCSSMEHPKLRGLEAVPYDDQNSVLRDPSGISGKMLLVSRDVLFICSLCDGTRSVPAIQEEWRRLFGEPPPESQVIEIIRQLDDCYFLENARFTHEKYRIEQEFLTSPVRKPFHAGTGYLGEPEELRRYLDEQFDHHNGGEKSAIRGIVAPHIDIARGIDCYTAVYSRLQNLDEVDLVVILGVSHSLSERSIILTGKDFETPFGVVPTDQAVIENLKGRLPYDFFADELLHRNEHSIEFQVLLLQYILPPGKEIFILPVLCSESGNLREETASFADALLQAVKESNRTTFVVAGADLSHLGKRFGQQLEMSPDYLKWAEEQDRSMLNSVCAGEAEDFLQKIDEEHNSRNVCGVPAIYTLLKLLGPVSSELVYYGQAVEENNSSMVSYAGITFC